MRDSGGSSFDLIEQPRNGNRLRTMARRISGLAALSPGLACRSSDEPNLGPLRADATPARIRSSRGANIEHADLRTEAGGQIDGSGHFRRSAQRDRALEQYSIVQASACRRREEFVANPSRRPGNQFCVSPSPVDCWRGNVTTNRLPPSASRGSTRIVPPCSSVNVRASANRVEALPHGDRDHADLRERIEDSRHESARCPDRCLHRR
jgi:hypothetical protein